MSRERRRGASKEMPPAFREQYFSLFAGPEPETLHSDLYRRLIDDGTDTIVRQLRDYNERRKKLLVKVREKIRVERIQRDEKVAGMRVAASDAGNNGVDLRSAYVPLYASAALVAEGWKIVDEPIFEAGEADVWADEFRTKDRESLLASKIQFEITEEAVERWEPELVVFDGSLLLNLWLMPTFGTTDDYSRDLKETMIRSIGLLHTCSERNIPIVGFAKRTRINHVCKNLGMPKMRDTALLDLVLRLGEYTTPEAEPMKGLVVNKYKKEAEKLGIPRDKIEKIMNVYSSYIRTGLTTPFRLEVPEYCLDRLKDIGTVLFTTSEEENGMPFSISEADSLTKVTTSISNIRTLMIYSKSLDLVRQGEMDLHDLNLLALQHGEPWAINDGRYGSNTVAEG
ncbi:MAG: DNA double-strand break repair nuclease NurA [Candidatus Bathyarchaeota archaeon]|nr:DNA double-strand break repair nuclease NurA [Candidatus Bathyarchaeota archaeon]